MPATVECHGARTGLTLTASLFPDGSDTAAATGVACTEATNRKTLYTFSTILTGLHLIQLKEGSTVRWIGWAVLAASGTMIAEDSRSIADGIDVELSAENIADIAEATAALIPEPPDAAEIAAALSGQVTLTGPVFCDGGLLILVEGDDYFYDEGRRAEWTISTTQGTWAGGSVALRLFVKDEDDKESSVSIAGTIVDETGSTRRVRFDITSADHADLLIGKGTFQIAVTRSNTHVGTEVRNGILIREKKIA